MCERFDYRSVSGAAEQDRSYGAHVDREPHLPGMASQLLTTGRGAVAPALEPPGPIGDGMRGRVPRNSHSRARIQRGRSLTAAKRGAEGGQPAVVLNAM